MIHVLLGLHAAAETVPALGAGLLFVGRMGNGACQISDAFNMAVTRGIRFVANTHGSTVLVPSPVCSCMQIGPKLNLVMVLAGIVMVVGFRTAEYLPLKLHIVIGTPAAGCVGSCTPIG